MDHLLLKLTPKMRAAIPIIHRVFKQYAPDDFIVEFTSGKELFGHALWSFHHSGNAIDIRTRTLPDQGIGDVSAKIAQFMQVQLNSSFGPNQYTVLYNDQGKSQPHIHVQYNKGQRISSPGDWNIDRSNTRLA